MIPPPDTSLTYRDAGVDIDRGNRLVRRIGPLAARTHRPGVVAGVGGFGALFELPEGRYEHPVLVSGTDGVGTKLRLAIDAERHDGVGIDLVAMCANDVLTLGAEPLFFLDYLATGRLDEDAAFAVVAGIARGCELAGAALIGGETAEMPGMYAPGDYDLAGFCVGVVERDGIVHGAAVRPGDRLLGIASSGPHSNGYSLIRRILEDRPGDLDRPLGDGTLADALLEPTRIYAASVLALLGEVPVRALAHVTGGGLTENLPRMLPDGHGALVRLASWEPPPVFAWIRDAGGVAPAEMLRTFNCGVGMVACVAPEDEAPAIEALGRAGERAWVLGEVVETGSGDPRVRYA